MFTTLEHILADYIHRLPLEVFVFVASIVEEIIAPIPSPTVMVLSGSVAHVQGVPLAGLIPLAIIGACGKVLGALVVYALAKWARDFVLRTCGRYFGVKESDVNALGARLGRGARDYVVLTFLRALPIMPSVILSVGSGLLRVKIPLFIIATFLGTIVRDGLYLYAGYVGTDALAYIVAFAAQIEDVVQYCILAALVVGVYIWYTKRKQKQGVTGTPPASV